MKLFTIIIMTILQYASFLSAYTNIIADAEFTNCRYSDEEIIALCMSKRGALCIADIRWSIKSARGSGISPVVVMAKLQHEASQIEGWPVARKHRDLAMGYHINDRRTWGYSNQVLYGSRALYTHFMNSRGVAFAYDKGTFRASHATVALYKYTPYWYVTRPCGWYGGNWSFAQIYGKYIDELESARPKQKTIALRLVGFKL